MKKALDGKKAALVEALQTKLAIHLEAAEASMSEVHPLPHAQHAPWLRGCCNCTLCAAALVSSQLLVPGTTHCDMPGAEQPARQR